MRLLFFLLSFVRAMRAECNQQLNKDKDAPATKFVAGKAAVTLAAALATHRNGMPRMEAEESPADPTLECTYIMIKPDGVQRGLVGDIIQRFEQRGYHLKAMK